MVLQQQRKWALLSAFCAKTSVISLRDELSANTPYMHEGKLSGMLAPNNAQLPDIFEPAQTPTKQLPEGLHQSLLGGRYPLWDLPCLVVGERSSDPSRLRMGAVLEHSIPPKYGPIQGSWGTPCSLKGIEDVCIATQ